MHARTGRVRADGACARFVSDGAELTQGGGACVGPGGIVPFDAIPAAAPRESPFPSPARVSAREFFEISRLRNPFFLCKCPARTSDGSNQLDDA